MEESVVASMSGVTDKIPDWCSKSVDKPSMASLQSDSGMAKAIEDIYHDTIDKHRILEQYPGMRAQGACDLIHSICSNTIKKLRIDGAQSVQSMTRMIDLISDKPEITLYKSDHTIRMACESAVINCLWKYVRHPNHIDTPAEFLKKHNNFEKERSHWWRARKAVETADHIKMKWEAMLGDIINLLNFHNTLNHTKDLLEKPTLKHTLHLAALTSEGRIFENGQGRSIASECRHILVRKACDIPIKSRPEKKASSSSGGGGGGSRKTLKAPRQPAVQYVVQNPRGGKMLVEPYEPSANIISTARGGASYKRQRTDNPFRALPESEQRDLREDALSLLNFKNNSPRSTDDNASSEQESMPIGGLGPPLLSEQTPGAGGTSPASKPPLMRAGSSDWPRQLGEGPEVPTLEITPFVPPAKPPLMRAGSADWPESLGMSRGQVPHLEDKDHTVFLNKTTS